MSNAANQSKLTGQLRKANRIALISLVIFLMGAALLLVSSSEASRKNEKGSALNSRHAAANQTKSAGPARLEKWMGGAPSLFAAFLPPAPGDPDLVETFAADCTTPKTAFVLGDTVCAKVSGGPPLSLYPRKIAWVDNFNNIQQSVDITTDPQTDLFTVPNAGGPVDYRGVWRVNSISAARSSVRASAFFTVSDPALPAADLSIYNGNDTDGSITAGSNIEHVLWFSNKGPDAATSVQVTDVTPANTTFLSGDINDTSWNCTFPAANSAGGTSICTLASLAPGANAKMTLVFNVNSGTSADTVIADTANISSTTPDPHDGSNTPPPDDPNADPSNNTATSRTVVVAGAAGATCTLQCPDNVTAIADTTEGGQRGAHVTFDDATPTGTCGNVTATPASGTFFPVGTTAVNVSSDQGDGACSFTVTVQDTGTNPPTITCPANKTADANGDCEAIVVLGTPTTSGDNVTVVGTRSDGKPMYDCDINNNCTRKSSDLPFSAGVTTVTWTATSHDAQGNPEGAASCQQTVTVNDTTPPVITATDQTVSADANCQAAVPDYSNQVTDNCACAANDTSQDCVGQHRIATTQDVPAGTMLGPGSYTIHVTANDGSSNNGGAGNTTTKDIVFTVKDTTPPTIHCPANITANTDPGTCSATVNPGTATATDNCDSSPTIVGTRSDGQPLNATYPKGTTTITWTATDHASPANSSSCIQTVTVEDHENPAISCPANITTGTDPNSCSATVNPGTPTASDNCGSPSVAGVRSDGQALNAPYPKGTTTITWTATDSSGNHSSCNQTITVNDTQPPVISCNADIIADFDPAVNGAVVTYTAPVGTDNCSGATTVQTAGLASGSTFPTGTTTNTFTVTDGAGLTATCSFKVTVALTSVIGLDSATLSGSAIVDSYDSTIGYPASKGSLANLASNGTVSILGSSKMFGNVRSTRVGVSVQGTSQVNGNATAGTTVTKGASAVITGTITNNALAPVMTMPSVPACGPPYSSTSGISGTYSYNSSTGDLTLSGINNATLANGTYCFHNVTLTNSAQLKVNGPVTIKLTGTINAGGASTVNNTTLIPANLRILSSFTGSNGVIFSNGNSAYLVIYAPQTSVANTGSAPLFGTIVGKTVTISNSGMLHYDTKLKAVWPDVWISIFGP